MGTLRELSVDLLSGRVGIEEAGPMAPRFTGEQVADRSYFVSSFANVSAFATDAARERSLMAKGVFTAAANPTGEE